MGQAVDDTYAIIPIDVLVTNDIDGSGDYDVSSLEPANYWREGYGVTYDADETAPPKDDAFIAEAKAAVVCAIDRAAKHFASLGAVIVPLSPEATGDDMSPGMALIVAKEDVHAAAALAAVLFPMPPHGRLKRLLVDTAGEWPASACPQTLPDLYSAALDASKFAEGWPQSVRYARDRLPSSDEEIDRWLARVCIPTDTLMRTLAAWDSSTRNVNLFSLHSMSIGNHHDDAINWLVPGLLQRGEVTSLVGAGGVGKTTLLAELVAKVGNSLLHETQFLGAFVEHSNGLCAYISAEDRPLVMKLRIEQYQAPGSTADTYLIDGCGRTIEDCLAELEDLPALDLVIIDPITQFVDDENEAGKVGPTYNKAAEFARRKNCVMVLVHHLTKSGKVRRTGDVRPSIRGSGVHVDRPRLVFCMLPKSDGTVEIGIVKSNLPPGQPAWGETGVGKMFKQTPGGLIAAEGNSSCAPAAKSDDRELISWVIDQLARHNDVGQIVRRTGQNSLYRLWRDGAVPFPRTVIENCVSDLVSSRRVIDDQDSGLTVHSSEGQ